MAHNSARQAMGEAIETKVDLQIEASVDDRSEGRAPGHGWSLSDETHEIMKEIDASIRAAEQMSGSLLVG